MDTPDFVTPESQPYLQKSNVRYPEDKARHAITIGVPPEEVYAFFRDVENLSLFMKDIEAVTATSSTESHWKARLKVGLSAEWDARITVDRPGEMIAWQSAEGSEVETSGSIAFYPAPQDMGTVVTLQMDYKIPGGKFAEIITKLSGEDPDTLALTNLKRLKAYLEVGEIATTEGQSSGREDDLEQPIQ